MNRYGDCTYCGGEVVEQTIEYDYRRQKHLMVVSNIPPAFAANAARSILSRTS